MELSEQITLAVVEGKRVRINRKFKHGPLIIPAGLYDVCAKCEGCGMFQNFICINCGGIGLNPMDSKLRNEWGMDNARK
jgi:hypothetical protein